MILNPQVEFKNKVYDSNYHETNPFSLFGWNSNFWSTFGGIHFFIAMRCSKELAGQLSLKSKVSSFSSESSSISTHRNSLNFDSKFISNLDEFL
jgi:hypothetical protein